MVSRPHHREPLAGRLQEPLRVAAEIERGARVRLAVTWTDDAPSVPLV